MSETVDSALTFGAHVIYAQKQPDGTVRRHNAIVLESRMHQHLKADRTAVGEDKEHVDLLFVRHVTPGHALKTRSADAIFQPAIDVAPFEEDATSGYEVPVDPSDYEADIKSAFKALEDELGTSRAKVLELAQENEALKAKGAQANQPSAQDLDAVAQEQQAAQDTAESQNGES